MVRTVGRPFELRGKRFARVDVTGTLLMVYVPPGPAFTSPVIWMDAVDTAWGEPCYSCVLAWAPGRW
jgi:hypothetical protein